MQRCTLAYLQQADTQRKTYKAGKLRKERFHRLNAIDFPWQLLPPRLPRAPAPEKQHNLSPKLESVWEERFNELVEFKRKHGHFSVPKVYNGSKKLDMWVSVGVFCSACYLYTIVVYHMCLEYYVLFYANNA